jgi:hypothetical protein
MDPRPGRARNSPTENDLSCFGDRTSAFVTREIEGDGNDVLVATREAGHRQGCLQSLLHRSPS